MSQEGGRSKIVAPTLDKDVSTSSMPDASDLSSLDTKEKDQDIALVEVQGPNPLPVLSESSQPVVPGQEVEEPDHQPETSANLPPDPLPKERPQRSVRPNPDHVQEHGPLRQAMPYLEQHEKAELDMQRKIEEEEMLLRAELDHLEAQQKADKARAEAQRKVEEAHEEAQGKAEEFKLRIEKTRKLNEMKDRLARIKTEKEHAKLQVDIKAAEVAAAILEAGSEVDDASMVLSSLAPLNRTRDLFLNRTDEVSSQPSNAVGTSQATSKPSASRIHKNHLKLTSHPLRYSNPAPNLHSQANMSIGNRQSCVKQDCELTTQSLNLQSNLHRLMKPVHHSHQDGSREVPLSTGPCQQLLFPKYSTSRVVDSIFDNTGYCDHLHREGDMVVLIHVPENYDFTMASPVVVEQLFKELEQRVDILERKYKEKLQDKRIPGKFRTADGKPGEVIVSIAREEQAAFIVTGTRGLGKFRRTLMGSVSDYIVHHSPVPVLVCRRKIFEASA
ncbi:hypothetical protein ACOMHN_023447 [Nucella lapillus]